MLCCSYLYVLVSTCPYTGSLHCSVVQLLTGEAWRAQEQ